MAGACSHQRPRSDYGRTAYQDCGIMVRAEPLIAEDGSFGEFCARFAFTETEDQLNAINEVVDDLASGKASDRLICGDVGFSKTEVALRAAIAAMAGYQALVAPTTLLARQHGKVFSNDLSVSQYKIGVLSRMTPTAEAKIREEIATGGANCR